MENKKKTTPFAAFWQKRRRVILLVAGALLGLLLLLVGAGGGKPTSESEADEIYLSLEELESYRQALQSELEKLCDAVAGVSSVEVIVTLERGTEVLYATDAQGNPIKLGSGTSATALPKSSRPPVVAGVGVVCRGGAQPSVQKALTDLLSTTLGISASRVCVVGK